MKIGRIFDNQTAVFDGAQYIEDTSKYEYGAGGVNIGDELTYPYQAFCYGWRLDIPRLEDTTNGEYLYLQNGSAHKLEWEEAEESQDGPDYSLEYHKGTHFSGEKYQEKTGKYAVADAEVKITLKNGVSYYFDGQGKVQSIIDRTGKNEIKFYYDKRKLERIEDTIGREVEFEYNSQGKIKKITSGNSSYQYKYNSRGILSEVIDPEGRKTEYDYKSVKVKYGYTSSRSKTIKVVSAEGNVMANRVSRNSAGEIQEKKIYRGGKLAYSQRYKYDNWGNVIYYYHSDSGLKKYMHYLNTDSTTNNFPSQYNGTAGVGLNQSKINENIHNLLADTFILNKSPDGNAVPVQSHYVYSKDGNLKLKAKWDSTDNQWVKRKFSYDDYGNIIKKVDPLDNVTEIEYSSEYSKAYPTKVVKKGENGSVIDNISGNYIITQKGYDKDTGKKKWEIDGEGNLTEYKYDKVNRVVKIIYPDDNDSYSSQIGSLSPDKYQGRSNNPVKIQNYDDDNNTTTVVNATRDLSVEDSRIKNNSVQDPVYNKSRYYYDGLNRWVKLNNFIGKQSTNTTRFYYNKMNKRKAVKDAEGYVTFTRYDKLGRIVKIIYPDVSKDLSSPGDNQLYTEIKYDKTENKRTVIDAEKNETEEFKDWSGNVIKVVKYLYAEKLKTTASYDQLGNKVKVVDAGGRVTHYKYNSLGRKIEEILPADEYAKPGEDFSITTHQPHKLYFYDQAGRKTAEITPNSYWLYGNNTDNVYSYEYNAAGNLIKETDPAGNAVRHYYDRNGKKVKTIDSEGNITQKEYTARGWLKAEAVVNGGLSNKAEIEDEDGDNDLITYYTYNIIGNKTSRTGPEGIKPASGGGTETVTLFQDEIYEHNGVNYQIDPEYTTIIEYNSLGRKTAEIREVAGEEIKTSYQYDRVGNKKEVINPGGKRTIYNYTPQYWLKEQITYGDNGEEHITSYQYDNVGNKTAVTDPAGNTTRYTYDQLYRQKTVLRPNGEEEIYYYDKVGKCQKCPENYKGRS